MAEIDVLPIEQWFSTPLADGSRVFLNPFGPETPEAVQYNPNVAPPQIVDQPRQREGIDILRGLSMSREDTVGIQVVLTESNHPLDLGPAYNYDDSGEFEENFRDDPDLLMVVYGLRGSIAMRESGLWAPTGGLVHPTEYENRLQRAGEIANKPVVNGDPRRNAAGMPAGPAERAVAAMGAKVFEMGMDPTDEEGFTQIGADIVYLDKVQWLQIPEVGHALGAEKRRRDGAPLYGYVQVVLPAESSDADRKFDLIGVTTTEPIMMTINAANPRNLVYADSMRDGGIAG